MSAGSETKILIVDDEPAIRKLLRAAFIALGCVVVDADCGDAALRLAAEAGPFSLVISDVVMPGIDGFDLAERLAAEGHAAAFLFISGYCDAADIPERIRALGAARYVPKPFVPSDLMQAARELLAPPPPAAA